MNAIHTLTALALGALLLGGAAGCSDDDDPVAPGGQTRTFTLRIDNISADGEFFAGGAFTIPVDAAAPAPIFPAGAYEFEIGARPGDKLSLATMFVQSNDLFYAPTGAGIDLFDGMGQPISGNVADQLVLWDAGTEANEAPGAGPNQAPRQSGPDTGPADSDAAVRQVDDGYAYPDPTDVIAVLLTPLGDGMFRVRVENVSDATTLDIPGDGTTAVPLSPGVYVVHTAADPLFTAGAADRGEGLEALAEDGDPAALAAALAVRTGIATPLAPGVVAVHTGDARLFEAGAADVGLGLEDLAEDGDPDPLAAALDGATGVQGVFTLTIPEGTSTAGPIAPGQSYSVLIEAAPGARVSFATMFVQSNDLFYAFPGEGLALFTPGGGAVTGDVTDQVMLWDAGTEANWWPGLGPDQAPRQSGPDTGAADPDDTVREVDDGYSYLPTDRALRVTLSVDE